MIHICYITHEYPKHGRTHGGIGKKIQAIAHRLVISGHRVTVLGLRNESNYYEDEGVKIKEIRKFCWPPIIRWFLNRKLLRYELLKLIKEEGVNIVEIQDSYSGLMPTRLPVPVIARFSNSHSYYSKIFNRKPRLLQSFSEKVYLPKAFSYASCSGFVADITSEIFKINRKNITVLYNPVDTTIYSNTPPSQIEKGLILFIGTVYWVKGVIELTEAFPEILKRCPYAKLVFLGRDHELLDKPGTSTSSYLWNLLPPEAKESVKFVGFLSREGVLEYLRKAEVFVLPSYIEGHSNALIEAQACGKAVVFGNRGAAREVIVDGVSGLLVEPTNPNDISNKICMILEDTDLRDSLGREARKVAEEKFSLDNLVPKNTDFFNDVIESWRKKNEKSKQSPSFHAIL